MSKRTPFLSNIHEKENICGFHNEQFKFSSPKYFVAGPLGLPNYLIFNSKKSMGFLSSIKNKKALMYKIDKTHQKAQYFTRISSLICSINMTAKSIQYTGK